MEVDAQLGTWTWAAPTLEKAKVVRILTLLVLYNSVLHPVD